MKHHLALLYSTLILLSMSLSNAQAQTYASVTDVPPNKWDFTVVDLNRNPVTTLAPNTSYYLYLRLNSGVVANVAAYFIQSGDGWYESSDRRPQTFPAVKDANTNQQSRDAYFLFTTVEANDFSGAFFKVILSSTGQPTGSPPKSKLFQ